MALPNSYTMKTGAITAYFDAMLNAEAPERFSQKFLAGLGFASSNDRLIIGILKELGFLNADGKPTDRYYAFLDKSVAQKMVAEGIREAYSDLFEVNKSAYELDANDAYDKLRSLYRGEKKDTVVKNIAKTFVALCNYADFSAPVAKQPSGDDEPTTDGKMGGVNTRGDDEGESSGTSTNVNSRGAGTEGVNLRSLQYHINIVLPDTRDQAVYDAIFKSLGDHLG